MNKSHVIIVYELYISVDYGWISVFNFLKIKKLTNPNKNDFLFCFFFKKL